MKKGIFVASLMLASGLAAQAQELPAGKDSDLVDRVCTACHNNGRVFQSNKDADGWKTTVDRMVGKGADASAEQAAQIIAYLAKYFGTTVNANKADAKTLQTELDLTADQAAAVIKYRTDNMTIKNLADLAKVPGIDAGKIKLFENRLEF